MRFWGASILGRASAKALRQHCSEFKEEKEDQGAGVQGEQKELNKRARLG